MDYSEIYYETVYGCYPHESEEPKRNTQKVFDYLIDNGYTSRAIMYLMDFFEPNEEGFLRVDELPDILWEESLIKRNVFYYHPALQIRSKAPSFNPVTGKTTATRFYLEMRIKFSKSDLMDYIRKAIKIPVALYDDKRDIGSVKFLLDKYKNINVVEPLDFVLYLADHLRQSDQMVVSILDISQAEQAVYEQCSKMVLELAVKKANQIVWR